MSFKLEDLSGPWASDNHWNTRGPPHKETQLNLALELCALVASSHIWRPLVYPRHSEKPIHYRTGEPRQTTAEDWLYIVHDKLGSSGCKTSICQSAGRTQHFV